MDDVATGSAQARLLDIDDELLVPFLSFDVEAVVRDRIRWAWTSNLLEIWVS